MSKILELRAALQTALKRAHDRVYYEKAPDRATYPYLVYNLSNSYDDGIVEQFYLDVDGWDAPEDGSTVALEKMMGKVDHELHRLYGILATIGIAIYRDRRLTVDEDDERIRRRKYVYLVRTIGG